MTALPPQIVRGASLHGNEYGWEPSAFLEALRAAEALKYACIGGQFQFRIADSVCEMYWLNADASERTDSESWSAYCHRSCAEVGERFTALHAKTDFKAEARNWASMPQGFDPQKHLVFVAYFVTEHEYKANRTP